MYDVTFNIRDKGKEQYQYLIDFKEVNKKMMPVSNTNQNGSPASAGTSSSKGMVSQNKSIVKGNNSGNLTNNTQNDFTDYSDYRNLDNGNVGLLDRDTEGVNKNEAVENENGAVDNNDTEFRTKKAEDYYKKAVNILRKSLSKAFNITNLRNDTRVNEIIKAVAKNQLQTGEIDAEGIDALFDELYSKGENLDNFHAKKDFYNALADFSKKLDDLYKYKNGKLNKPSDVLNNSLEGNSAEEKFKLNDNRLASDEEISNFVDYAYRYAEETNIKGNKDFPKQQDHIRYAKVSEKLKNDIFNYFGVTIKNKYHALRDNDIRHLINSHGEGTNEKYPVTKEDIKNIPNIVDNYDDVLWVQRDDGKKGIVYVKRHNGVTYYLEGALNDELLINKQMIKVPTGTIPDVKGIKDAINKKWNIFASPNDKNIPRMYVQDVWSHNVPNDSIPNDNNIVKENASTINNNLEQSKEDYLMEAYEKKRTLQKDYEKALKNILLSEQDRVHLERWVKGEIKEEHIPPEANIEGIKELYKYRSAIENENQKIKQYNAIRKENLHKRADSLLENSDNWKEKRIPVLYEVETMKRNIRSMVNDKATADSIIDEYFRPVGDNEALKEKFMRKYKDRIRGLKLVRIKHKDNRVSESYAVQFLGELNGEIEHLEERNNITQEEKLRLEELKETRETFLSENKALKMDKINDAIKVFRETYDELFNEMNRVRVRNGYTPVEYRHNYFPHFAEDETDGLLHKFGSMILFCVSVKKQQI